MLRACLKILQIDCQGFKVLAKNQRRNLSGQMTDLIWSQVLKALAIKQEKFKHAPRWCAALVFRSCILLFRVIFQRKRRNFSLKNVLCIKIILIWLRIISSFRLLWFYYCWRWIIVVPAINFLPLTQKLEFVLKRKYCLYLFPIYTKFLS